MNFSQLNINTGDTVQFKFSGEYLNSDDELKKGVEAQYVQINDVLVRDVTLPNTIKQAIERKLSQEQMSLEYEFKLEFVVQGEVYVIYYNVDAETGDYTGIIIINEVTYELEAAIVEEEFEAAASADGKVGLTKEELIRAVCTA